MENKKQRSSFSGSLGFVLAAAGSAVGLGNIWRFPNLAAKGGGGVFLLVYIILALTFGFTLLTTEIAIGRKTKQSQLTAYSKINKKWGFLGIFASIVPIIIMPYYCVIGGWVIKYFITFTTNNGVESAADGYFTSFISEQYEPIILTFIFLAVVAFIIYRGVNNGIETLSKILMPVLLILVIGIAIFSLTIRYEDEGVVRTGLEGFKIYVIPDFDGMTLGKFIKVLLDAMGQLFFSLSVAMGIMITYGSYVKDDDHLVKSINQIEIFDTIVAFLAGVMVIPAVFAFMGRQAMEDTAGPGLMFVALPKVFEQMGGVGTIVGIMFFAMVLFAAITSAVSIMEAIVSCLMDKFKWSRIKATVVEFVIALVGGIIVCLGYNQWFFNITLPNGDEAQILDIMDYVSNQLLMPIVAIGTCLLIGWKVGPKFIVDEAEKTGCKFGRKKMYIIMIRYIAPVLLSILLLKAMGLINVK